MRRHVAFLHTSPVHVETFERLVKAVDPTVQVEHIVAGDLLADAQKVGADDPALVERVRKAMAGAASNGASIVVCTCSTIGGVAERAPTGTGAAVARIDRAMAVRGRIFSAAIAPLTSTQLWRRCAPCHEAPT